MNQAPYIPPRLADFAVWLDNFATLIAADPTDYGLVAGDATIISGQNTAFQAAYLTGTNPATRTTPTVAAMNVARINATAIVRPYAVQISRNPAVSDELKLGVGVNLPNNAPVPVPPIETAAALILESAGPLQHVLQFRDSTTPTSKQKPFGAIGLELWRKVGTTAATVPSECSKVGTFTKTPFRQTFAAEDKGKMATYFARWITRSGTAGAASEGPWSLPLVAGIP